MRNAKGSTERDWTTKAGLRAVCVLSSMGHRCGYVEIPDGHWLHGVDYSADTPIRTESMAKEPIGKRGPIDLVLLAWRETMRAGTLFDVHGGITFSGVPWCEGVEGGYWYGFDCAHWDDRENPKDEEYVVAECESLAEQVAVKFILPTPPAEAKP